MLFEQNENKERKTWEWNDTIPKEEGDAIGRERNYAKLPDGLHKFTFTDYKTEHYNGSKKIPECESVKLVLQFDNPDIEGETVTIFDRLPQCTMMEWKIEQFFKCFRHGMETAQTCADIYEALEKMIGARGEAHIGTNTYERQDGVKVTTNVVKSYLSYTWKNAK